MASSRVRPVTLAASIFMLVVSVNRLISSPAIALGFDNGEISGSWDTTLSYGLSMRISDRDDDLVAAANGGKGFSPNIDDGNLNYDDGDIFSNIIKLTSEIEVNYNDIGAFIRGSAFYDYENEDSDRRRTRLSGDAKDLVGSRARLLDAYGWYRFDLGSIPSEIRVGNQVLSWGESTFIQNGINSINPVNVNAIRVPGAELKEALLPVPMVVLNLETTENTALEAFYQWQWEKTEIDPAGSYFSSNDFAGEGGDRIILGRGTYSDGGGPGPEGGFTPAGETFQAIQRAPDREASDSPQFGVALHWFVPELNDTEFGFFFIRNHSRLPIISAITGTADGFFNAAGIAGPPDNPTAGSGALVAGTVLGALQAGTPEKEAIQAGIQAGMGAGQTEAQATTIAASAADQKQSNDVVKGAITDAATDAFAKTVRYRTEYPEDIKLLGASFNTQLGTSGWALQGEASYHWDVPVQVNTIELVGAALGALNPDAAAANQLGNFFQQFETVIPGFAELDVLQLQTTASRVFGNVFGANQLALVGEIGVTHIVDYPSQTTGGPNGHGLRLNGPNTGLGGNANLVPGDNQAFAGKKLNSEHFVSETSWGYQIRSQLTYNNAIGSINLLPRIAWRHDVNGISPGPGENFLEQRKAVSVGLAATYLNNWRADIGYTNFFGAGKFNLLNDRDFVAGSLSYSF